MNQHHWEKTTLYQSLYVFSNEDIIDDLILIKEFIEDDSVLEFLNIYDAFEGDLLLEKLKPYSNLDLHQAYHQALRNQYNQELEDLDIESTYQWLRIH